MVEKHLTHDPKRLPVDPFGSFTYLAFLLEFVVTQTDCKAP